MSAEKIIPYSKDKLMHLYNHAILEYRCASNESELDTARMSMSRLEGIALEYYGESVYSRLQAVKGEL